MKIYIKSKTESQFSSDELQPIEVDKHWMYLPLDDSEVFANPITYAGDNRVKQVVAALYGWDYDVVSENIESIDLNDLQSVQAFVTEDGLVNSRQSTKDSIPYAVRFEGNIYLMDGNHRVAKAFLDGANQYRMKVLSLEKV